MRNRIFAAAIALSALLGAGGMAVASATASSPVAAAPSTYYHG